MDSLLLNAPAVKGGNCDGTQYFPERLREYSDITTEWQTTEFNSSLQIPKYYDCLRTKIESLNNFDRLITIGGEHGISLATIHALTNEDTSVIWVDSHTDSNTIKSSKSGNFHGMVLSALTGQDNRFPQTIDPEWVSVFSPSNIEEQEREFITDYQVIEETDGMDYMERIDEVIKYQNNLKTENIHLSIDLDWFSPDSAPGVCVREKSGPNKKEGINVINKIIKQTEKPIHSIDIVEGNTLKDKENKTLETANSLLKVCM